MKITNWQKNLLILFVFAAAMAYLESAVVVYLRQIYYPDGFKFPLEDIEYWIYVIEIGREVATIIMLATVAQLIHTSNKSWFAYFAFGFGVWDIWYYVWLKIFLNWPAGLLDWDILFLIPLPWVGPVLAPVLVSAGLITASVLILKLEHINKPLQFSRSDWLIEVVAGLLIITSFLFQLEVLEQKNTPEYYPWWMFIAAFIIGTGQFAYRFYQTFKGGRTEK